MRLACFFLIFSMLYGCMPNQSLSASAASETNIASLFLLEKGMTQAQVLKIMRQPYSDTVFLMDNDTYDVWFYVARPTVLGQSRMMPRNLVPLTFKNGILIGWGYLYYNFLKKQELEAKKSEIPPALEEAPTQKALENQELEKILKESVKPQGTPAPLPLAPKPSALKGEQKTPSAPPQKNPSQTEPNWGPISPEKAPAPAQTPEKTPVQAEPNLGPISPQGNSKGNPSQTGPNWAPLAPQPANPEEGQQKSGERPVSMSKKPAQPKESENNKAPSPEKEENKVPLNKGDEEMLQQEQEQDFDQT